MAVAAAGEVAVVAVVAAAEAVVVDGLAVMATPSATAAGKCVDASIVRHLAMAFFGGSWPLPCKNILVCHVLFILLCRTPEVPCAPLAIDRGDGVNCFELGDVCQDGLGHCLSGALQTERGDTKANVERKHWYTRERLARCWSRQSTRSSVTIREQRHTFSSYKRLKGQEHEKM